MRFSWGTDHFDEVVPWRWNDQIFISGLAPVHSIHLQLIVNNTKKNTHNDTHIDIDIAQHKILVMVVESLINLTGPQEKMQTGLTVLKVCKYLCLQAL